MPAIIAMEPQQRTCLAALFAEQLPNMLLESVLEGAMGTAFADACDAPQVARASFGEVHFFAGDAGHPAAPALVQGMQRDHVAVAPPPPWRALLESIWPRGLLLLPTQDFDARSLDEGRLSMLRRRLPEGYALVRTDEALAARIETELGSPDHVGLFASPADFCRRGRGYCVLHDGRIVCAASSSAVCRRGIEVQINTHQAHRRRGLATATAAALLLECLSAGLEPHWSTYKPKSAALAASLGYVPGRQVEVLVRVR